MPYRRAAAAWSHLNDKNGSYALLNGDCKDLLKAIPDNQIALALTSPPYCMGKEYEPGNKLEDFIAAHEELLPEIIRVVKPGGSICWQIGYHVANNHVTPLDYLIFDAMRKLSNPPKLRNRISWTYGHGLHCEHRFSGRHETILWFTKGDDYLFDLDAVRVPQLYPGKISNKGPSKGKPSGNPLGKNPSDVWDIPNVKSNHLEKLDHPCQFPTALVARLVNALTIKDDIVLDPYAGVATTGVAALRAGRRFIGSELKDDYAKIGAARLIETVKGTVRVREDTPVQAPKPNTKLSIRPSNFRDFDSVSATS